MRRPSDVVDPMTPVFYRVGRRRQDTQDVFTFTLEPKSQRAKQSFQPGQFNMLYAFGVGEVPISISGDPDEPKSWVHTIRDVGATTKALAKLKKGGLVGVRGPFGTRWPVVEAVGQDVVVIAGGLGLAPLRPALYHIVNHRKQFGRVTLLYGARTSRDLLYGDELERWTRKSQIEILVALGQADRRWKGAVGHVTTFIPSIALFPEKTLAFLCGPEVMMRFCAMELEKRGLPAQRIFLSMERNMKCAVGFCGHCQFGPHFICKDGPIFPYDRLAGLLRVREL